MIGYITNAEYKKQKAALTRAINSGDPDKIIATCTKTVQAWEDKAWPDDWARWQAALDSIGTAGQWHRINLEDLT